MFSSSSSKASCVQSQPSCKPRCSALQPPVKPHSTVTRAAAGSDKKHGWHWPFHRSSAADAEGETEIVYVTDTAEADEVIEEPEYVEASHQEPAQQQPYDGDVEVVQSVAAHQPSDAAQQQHHEQQQQIEQQVELDQEPYLQDVPEAVSVAANHLHQQQQQQDSTTSAATTQPQRPAFASSSLAVPASSSYWASSAGGWVVALSLLIAVRQGRAHADAARLDVRALQARQQESRVQVCVCRDEGREGWSECVAVNVTVRVPTASWAIASCWPSSGSADCMHCESPLTM